MSTCRLPEDEMVRRLREFTTEQIFSLVINERGTPDWYKYGKYAIFDIRDHMQLISSSFGGEPTDEGIEEQGTRWLIAKCQSWGLIDEDDFDE